MLSDGDYNNKFKSEVEKLNEEDLNKIINSEKELENFVNSNF
jgi:hypothetical protein